MRPALNLRAILPLSLVLLLAACSGLLAPASSGAAPGSAGATSSATTSAPSSPAPVSSGAGTSASGSVASSGSAAASGTSSIPTVEDLTEKAVELVSPSVVLITHAVQGGQVQGSGSIIDAKGYILTNAHVAEGATTYKVTRANNQQVDAKLIGLDSFDDLAIIQVNVPNLPVVQMGDSSSLKVGQTVLAIGNPIGFKSTVTSGIISALGRTIPEPPSPVTGQATTIPNMIQTSAPINPGNSGGALIDLNGKLIGVPTLAATDPEIGGVAQGIGFAVPINTAKAIVPQLIQNGRVTNSGRAFLGVATADVTPQIARIYGLPVSSGAYIVQVVSGSGAEKAGLKQGDIIVKLGSQQITSTSTLQDALLQQKPGDQVPVTYYQGNQQRTTTVTLQEATASPRG